MRLPNHSIFKWIQSMCGCQQKAPETSWFYDWSRRKMKFVYHRMVVGMFVCVMSTPPSNRLWKFEKREIALQRWFKMLSIIYELKSLFHFSAHKLAIFLTLAGTAATLPRIVRTSLISYGKSQRKTHNQHWRSLPGERSFGSAYRSALGNSLWKYAQCHSVISRNT